MATRKYTVTIFPHLHVAIGQHGPIYRNAHRAMSGRGLIPGPKFYFCAIVDDPVSAPTLSVGTLANDHIVGIKTLRDNPLYDIV